MTVLSRDGDDKTSSGLGLFSIAIGKVLLRSEKGYLALVVFFTHFLIFFLFQPSITIQTESSTFINVLIDIKFIIIQSSTRSKSVLVHFVALVDRDGYGGLKVYMHQSASATFWRLAFGVLRFMFCV